MIINKKTIISFLTSCFAMIMLNSCQTEMKYDSEVIDYAGHYKVGSTYKIDDKSYFPAEDEEYSEIGVASWYGTKFHGRKTANGDKFDKRSLTAAHRTLPLPSMVKVTNLENGKSLIVMINDRGPFAKGRILDLSEKAAEELNMKHSGSAKVKVQFLKAETEMMLKKLSIHKKDKEEFIVKNLEEMNSKYFVQVASSRNKTTANRIAKDYAKYGKTTVKKIASNKNTILYRVRIGPFDSKKEASRLLKKITLTGNKKAIIVATL